MIHNFSTDKIEVGEAALIVYAIYKSSDGSIRGIDMWGQIERFARVAAKRSNDVGEFINKFKRKIGCSTINPKYLGTRNSGEMMTRQADGSIISVGGMQRVFMTDILQKPQEEQKAIIDVLYQKTQLVILLVRDRLEREKMLGGLEDE